eukprot:scaffold339613_cov48-Attheya_sp.AAC.1
MPKEKAIITSMSHLPMIAYDRSRAHGVLLIDWMKGQAALSQQYIRGHALHIDGRLAQSKVTFPDGRWVVQGRETAEGLILSKHSP